MGVLLGKLGSIKEKHTVVKHENSKGMVVYEDFNFSADIYFTFYQIVQYGKEDISIVVSLLEAVNKISHIAVEENLQVLKEFSQYIYDISIDNFTHKFDRELIKKSKYKINI